MLPSSSLLYVFEICSGVNFDTCRIASSKDFVINAITSFLLMDAGLPGFAGLPENGAVKTANDCDRCTICPAKLICGGVSLKS